MPTFVTKASSHWQEPRFVTPHLSYSWSDDSADEGTNNVDKKVGCRQESLFRLVGNNSLQRSLLIGQNLDETALTSLIAGVTIVLMKEPALMEK